MNEQSFFSICQERVDRVLEQQLPQPGQLAPRLIEAMRYSVFNGGKRVRPILVYATADALFSDQKITDGVACAVELIHAYSLIHDDLPAMDDDDLRRGKLTCHIQFDEATAILAGDALQALAFEVLLNMTTKYVNSETALSMLRLLAKSIGTEGMVAGQSIDLDATGKTLTLSELEIMHRYKTGALINASVMLAVLACGSSDLVQASALECYANHVGLAFQIRDDIIDVEVDSNTLGKPQGSDAAANKPTYPSIMGIEEAKNLAQQQHEKALAALDIFGSEADNLRFVSEYIVKRGT